MRSVACLGAWCECDVGSIIPSPPLSSHPIQRVEEDRHVQEMLDSSTAMLSSSSWYFPVVLVQKKDGSTRLYIDYHCLYDFTIKEATPLPPMDDSLS